MSEFFNHCVCAAYAMFAHAIKKWLFVMLKNAKMIVIVVIFLKKHIIIANNMLFLQVFL